MCDPCQIIPSCHKVLISAPGDNKVREKRGLRKPGAALLSTHHTPMSCPDFERETHRRMAARHQIDEDSLLANFRLPQLQLPVAQALRCYPVRSYIQTVGTLDSSTFPQGCCTGLCRPLGSSCRTNNIPSCIRRRKRCRPRM